MAVFNARGPMMALFTPLNNDHTINYAVIPAYAQYVHKSGVKSILVGGTTAEHVSLSVEDRKKLLESWMAVAGDLHVQAHVGGASLAAVRDMAKHAQSVGAGSLLVLPELYFKPKTVDELVSYIELVAQAAPNVPVFYYHTVRSHVELNMPAFVAKATARIPNFKGLKWATTDLNEASQTLRALKPDQEMFIAKDTLLAPATLLGFTSCMLTTLSLFPQLGQDIVAAVEASDVPKARKLQETLTLAVEALTAEGEWVPTMKAGMEIVTGIKMGPPSLPATPISEEAKKRIEGKLRNLKLVK